PPRRRVAGSGDVRSDALRRTEDVAVRLLPVRRRHATLPRDGVRALRDEDGRRDDPREARGAARAGVHDAPRAAQHHVRAERRGTAGLPLSVRRYSGSSEGLACVERRLLRSGSSSSSRRVAAPPRAPTAASMLRSRTRPWTTARTRPAASTRTATDTA